MYCQVKTLFFPNVSLALTIEGLDRTTKLCMNTRKNGDLRIGRVISGGWDRIVKLGRILWGLIRLVGFVSPFLSFVQRPLNSVQYLLGDHWEMD